jgi:aspartyl-tRNA(Asn)/glutamyl-tRNA(Gln) amidotransferase subunit C
MNVEEIKHLATLARIRVSDEQAVKFAGQIDGILKYVDEINSLNPEALDPALSNQNSKHLNIFKSDELSTLSQDEKSNIKNSILNNAPKRSGDSVVVPKVIK